MSTDKATGKPKGFGFIELADHVALTVCSRYPWAKLATSRFGRFLAVQRALRLHHTLLDNRRINVEVTAGGGGKSENRTAKIKMRNDKLRSIQARAQSS